LDIAILELLEMAETPLYSMYCVALDDLGGNVSLAAFLEHVDELVQNGVLRLWQVDDARERKELRGVPEELEQSYGRVADLDRSYDPFRLTLTLGPAAPDTSEPNWEVDTDFERKRFVMLVRRGPVVEAFDDTERVLPAFKLVERSREHDGSLLRIEGDLLDADE
jgi:hypothetical protein